MSLEIISQLSRLPEPYRSQAIYNHEHFPMDARAFAHRPKIVMPSQAIMWGFVHHLCPEPLKYWPDAAVQFDYHYFASREPKLLLDLIDEDHGFIMSDLLNAAKSQ